jgi:hypothetical protein
MFLYNLWRLLFRESAIEDPEVCAAFVYNSASNNQQNDIARPTPHLRDNLDLGNHFISSGPEDTCRRRFLIRTMIFIIKQFLLLQRKNSWHKKCLDDSVFNSINTAYTAEIKARRTYTIRRLSIRTVRWKYDTYCEYCSITTVFYHVI